MSMKKRKFGSYLDGSDSDSDSGSDDDAQYYAKKSVEEEEEDEEEKPNSKKRVKTIKMQEILDKYNDLLQDADESNPEGKKNIENYIKDNFSEIRKDIFDGDELITSSSNEQVSTFSKLQALYYNYKPKHIVFGINGARINPEGFGGRRHKRKSRRRKSKRSKTKRRKSKRRRTRRYR